VSAKKSKPKRRVNENTRADDERLSREQENADPARFERLVSPLFRSRKNEHG
jgi:hypothetical protein